MKVILLNQDYSYINSISVRRALKLLAKGKVTVEKFSERVVRTATEEIAVPMILRLVYLVRQIYRKAVTWSKRMSWFGMISNVSTAEPKKVLTLTMFFPSRKEARTPLKTQ